MRPRLWHDPSIAFGARLLASVVAVLAIIGVVGYLLIDAQLRQRQLDSYATTQVGDVKSLQDAGSRSSGSGAAGREEVGELIHAIGRRPGVIETLLIDRGRIVRDSVDPALVGTRDTDSRIEAALRRGEHYAGHEADPSRDGRDFEFVMPFELHGARYVLEVAYNHRTLDADLNAVRRTLALLGLLVLVCGGGVFYLIGGRALLRSHRSALQRATRDGLTDLPNQRAFEDDFPAAVAAASRSQDPFALALLDLDDFKFLNDRYGHPQGDALLKRVADVLRTGRAGDRAYRIGGDEFALLLTHNDIEGARTSARRVNRALADVGAIVSVGTSVLRDGQPADELRAEADAALYEAKRRGGNQIAHFDDIRDRVVVTSADKRDSVRRLIAEGRFTTVFQPIWKLDAGALLGVEALTRPDPCYELNGPAEAFDIAEQLGHVRELDQMCARRALEAGAQRPEGALLFVNLAPQTLDLDADDGDDWLRRATAQAGIAPEDVVVEVTERFGARTDSVIKALQRLRAQGFKLALDDVGTGNSGLEMLRKVDAEFVKLDQSIVAAAATEPNARAVLMAMATFASQTGAFVIAEGVEDEETLAFLRRVDEPVQRAESLIQGAQGFGLGRPSPAMPTETTELLRQAAPSLIWK